MKKPLRNIRWVRYFTLPARINTNTTGEFGHGFSFSRLLFVGWLLLYAGRAYAQQPVINSVSKFNASINELITINGTGFGSTAAQTKVYFGAVAGEITAGSATSVTVKTPAGTTFQAISVTNLQSGLTAYSGPLFLASFGGSGFDGALMNAQVDFPAETGLYDLCACDFDGDGKTDVASSNSQASSLSVFRNTSTVGTISFEKTNQVINAPTLDVQCGDLDSDGKSDLVATKGGTNGNEIYVFRNTSTAGNISFATVQTLQVSVNSIRQVAIADLDGNGKPELILTNEANNSLSVFVNSSTIGNLSFSATPSTFPVQGATNTFGLSVEDLNSDKLPDIAINPSLTSNLFVLVNRSTPGNIAFDAALKISVSGNLVNVKIGDLDGDGKPDLATTSLLANSVAILLNTSTTSGGAVQFAAPTNVSTTKNPWGLDMGDLDGDGKADLAVASTDNTKLLTVLRNTSSPGALSFEKTDLSTLERSRHVKIADIDGDGKPEITFTGIDKSHVSVLRNKHCLVPKITPGGTVKICGSTPERLTVNESAGTVYRWTLGTTVLQESTATFWNAATAGVYQVTAISAGCSKTSVLVTVELSAGASPPTPQASNSGPVCAGNPLNLSATTIASATYAWTGPNNFSSSEQNPVISAATTAASGVYSVRATVAGCQSPASTTTVIVGEKPSAVTITAVPSLSLCAGQSATLSVANVAGNTYQWKKDGQLISGAQTANYVTSQAGAYSVVIGTSFGCNGETDAVTVKITPPPVASFTTDNSGCVNQPANFQSTSTGSVGEPLSYTWDFGDGQTGTGATAVHTYSTASSYTVKLTVGYDANASCQNSTTKTFEVIAVPVVTILSSKATICSGDSTQLTVDKVYSSYLWSTGETKAAIFAKTAGEYKLKVRTTEGCEVEAQTMVNGFPGTPVAITTDKTTFVRGDSVQMQASGAVSYSWSPTEGLSDPLISNPIAKPTRTTVYVVTAQDANGCQSTAEVTLTEDNDLNVTPRKIVSPNGDGTNDLWKIDNIELYPDCTVAIYDRQGRKIYEAQPYLNDWDATYKGKDLIEGAYYYIIQCNNSTGRKGTITVIR
jgi:gliding motility-associated-like protein